MVLVLLDEVENLIKSLFSSFGQLVSESYSIGTFSGSSSIASGRAITSTSLTSKSKTNSVNLSNAESSSSSNGNSNGNSNILDSISDQTEKIIKLQEDLHEWFSNAEKTIEMTLEIRRLHSECAEYERKRDGLIATLVATEAELSELVFSLRQRYQLMLAARKNPISDVNEFLAYARNVGMTSSAPFGWNPSLSLRLTRPPNPQEDMMRNSLLYQKMLESNAAKSKTLTIDSNTHQVEKSVKSVDDGNLDGNNDVSMMSVDNHSNEVKEHNESADEFDLFDL